MKKIWNKLFLTILAALGILMIFALNDPRNSDLIQFLLLIGTILAMYIPLTKQSKKEKEYQKLELGQLSKQLLSIVEYVELNCSEMDELFGTGLSDKKTIVKLKSMISELKQVEIKVLNQAQCELGDPSYSTFKLFDIYEIGTDGITKDEFNQGRSHSTSHNSNQDIISNLKARIRRIIILD